jgi:hypothetical protein
MRNVVLEFKSLKDLIDFTVTAGISNCEIDRTKFCLFCEMEEADIELALRGFDAIVIK